MENKIELEKLRHSTSHVMAQAVLELFPGTKLAIGPAIEDGFYYDFNSPRTFLPEDLEKIEQKMKEIVKNDHKFTSREMSKEEAKKFFGERNEKYKVELLENIPDEKVTLYQDGDFIDLCRGPHIESTKQIKHFKLLSVAGAYWRGDEKREQLQRIYGTVFPTKEELADYLNKLEEAKKRDHRKLGVQLDLFSTHEQVGAGLVHWHPKGTIIRNIIENLWKEEHTKHGYQLVSTPHIASEEIYKTSGHLEKYSDMIYSPMDIDGRPFRVKPMNCPNHIMIYKTKLHSYRELPVRYAELGTVYRYEKSGVLHGLLRVRGFTIDDAHIFCKLDQLEQEMLNIFDFTIKFLQTFGFREYDIYLATKPEKFVGSEENWAKAIDSLKNAMEKTKYPYRIDEGGGAFYGPKVDIKIKDVLGRAWQCSTIQFDFNLAERFDITYRDESGKDERVFMIHRALLGSMERFFGVLIEHYAGAFPLWLSPVQVVVINISESQKDYAENVTVSLKNEGIRAESDLSNERLNYKIREATVNKIPYIVIVGDKEKQSRKVSARHSGRDIGQFELNEFIEKLKSELKQKINNT
ncbi:MAG: threonine--tRNA ligase [Elusimicrobia bacterium CG1_02_37_114]|nr:MAG: threonine--tRNA ligase [Elusimicrobia bacterium CG1_02_37_114]